MRACGVPELCGVACTHAHHRAYSGCAQIILCTFQLQGSPFWGATARVGVPRTVELIGLPKIWNVLYISVPVFKQAPAQGLACADTWSGSMLVCCESAEMRSC